jgi:septal ring factor EnvC (AmiA/AmiB activator)
MTEKCKKCNDELKEAKKEIESLKDQLFNEKKEKEKSEETLAAAKTDNTNLTEEKYGLTKKLKTANEKIADKLGYDQLV